MRGFSETFLAVSGLLYVMLMTNFLLVITGLPVWVLALLVDLRQSWLWVAVCAILLAPGLAGAYAVFTNFSVNASVTALRTFCQAWWHSWRRVGLVGLGFQVFFFVVVVDFYAMNLWGLGLLALPLAVVLFGLGTVTALTSWVGLLERPDLKRWAVVKASLFYCVRRPGWSLLSLVILCLEASIIWVKPAIGLGLLLAPALYVVWGNARRTLADILPTNQPVVDDNAPVEFSRRSRVGHGNRFPNPVHPGSITLTRSPHPTGQHLPTTPSHLPGSP